MYSLTFCIYYHQHPPPLLSWITYFGGQLFFSLQNRISLFYMYVSSRVDPTTTIPTQRIMKCTYYTIYMFDLSLLDLRNNLLTLPNLCSAIEKTLIIFIIWMIKPCTRTPNPWVMKSTILVDHSVVIITIYYVSKMCLAAEKNRHFLKEILN